jgi:cytoskeleton protein RodZ
VLVILVLVAVIYGVYSYYSEIVDSRNDIGESLTLALPKNETSIENPATGPEIGSQDTFVPEDDTQDTTGEVLPRGDVLVETQTEIQIETQIDSEDHPETIAAKANNTSQDIRVETQPVAAGDDVVELIAHEDTWTEVVDNNDIALIYDLVRQEQTVILRGTAPFEIFLGNAPAMEVRVNGIKIDMTKFVRSNKIAHFYVSTSDQRVVFH